MEVSDSASQNGTQEDLGESKLKEIQDCMTTNSVETTNSYGTKDPTTSDKNTPEEEGTKNTSCETNIGQDVQSIIIGQNEEETNLSVTIKVEPEEETAVCDLQDQALLKDKPYTCAVCLKSFAQKSNLITHFRVHTGSRPYMCMDCGKSFSTSSNAVTHQRVHTGERPYSCGECGKTFSISSNLVTHQRVHTGERPYICIECGKSFTHRSNLVIHKRAHSGEKPYACFTCGKKFTHSSHLVAHQKVHI